MEIGAVENHRFRESGSLVYPVYSRRSRGLSVGLNLFPDRKICSFDCPYCEVFPFRSKNNFSHETFEIELRQVLDQAKKQKDEVRDLCFSGNGEPANSPHFAAALNSAARLRDGIVPAADIVVITNGTGLLNDDVFDLLKNSAAPPVSLKIWLKLDAGTPSWYQAMNRSAVSFEKLIAKIRDFSRCAPFTIQTMVCAAEGKAPSHEEKKAWEDLVLDLAGGHNITNIHLYGKARPAPEDPLTEALPVSFLEERAASLRSRLADIPGISVPVEVFP
ncbi:radical SAM protein [Spirochaetia bacterium]|nr:radical SAM protein [Spirochaetia bacterium]